MCASRSYSKFDKRLLERKRSGNVAADSNSCCCDGGPADGSGSQYNIYVIQHKCPYCNNLVSPPLCSQHQPPPTPSCYYGGNCYPYPSPYQNCPPQPYPYNRCSVNCNPLCCEPSAVMMKSKPNAQRKKCCIIPGLDESQAECPCCKAGKCPCCRTGKECGKSYDDKSIQSDQSILGGSRGSSGSRRRASVSSSVQTSMKERGPSFVSRRTESKERHEIRRISRGRSAEGEVRRFVE